MNRKEYCSGKHKCYKYHVKVQKLLKDWKTENNITDICDVHHRDDTEETRKYNEEHYELWGFNEDGTFEPEKYVVFMTHSDHVKYHMHDKTGELAPFYGKHHTAETKAKISATKLGTKMSDEVKAKMSETRKGENNNFYGKTHTDETKAKMRATHKANLAGVSLLYKVYKNNGGTKSWSEFRKALKIGDITFSDYEITILNNK